MKGDCIAYIAGAWTSTLLWRFAFHGSWETALFGGFVGLTISMLRISRHYSQESSNG